jgi:hypothetical protein
LPRPSALLPATVSQPYQATGTEDAASFHQVPKLGLV